MYLSVKGFTFIELMVVISIIAVLSLVGYANLGPLKEDKTFQNTAEEVQTLLRTAQTNATSSVICDINPNAAKWFIAVVDNHTLTLNCYNNTKASDTLCGKDKDKNNATQNVSLIKTVDISKINPNTVIDSISGTPNNASLINITICFSPILTEPYSTTPTNPVEFYDSGSSIFSSDSEIQINLKNNKTLTTKIVTVSSGGTTNVR